MVLHERSRGRVPTMACCLPQVLASLGCVVASWSMYPLLLYLLQDQAMVCAGLLAGIQARAQTPEYARLLSDCQILYCDTRLQLVSGVTRNVILHMSSQTLPVLARDGWAYLMQVS